MVISFALMYQILSIIKLISILRKKKKKTFNRRNNYQKNALETNMVICGVQMTFLKWRSHMEIVFVSAISSSVAKTWTI